MPRCNRMRFRKPLSACPEDAIPGHQSESRNDPQSLRVDAYVSRITRGSRPGSRRALPVLPGKPFRELVRDLLATALDARAVRFSGGEEPVFAAQEWLIHIGGPRPEHRDAELRACDVRRRSSAQLDDPVDSEDEINRLRNTRHPVAPEFPLSLSDLERIRDDAGHIALPQDVSVQPTILAEVNTRDPEPRRWSFRIRLDRRPTHGHDDGHQYRCSRPPPHYSLASASASVSRASTCCHPALPSSFFTYARASSASLSPGASAICRNIFRDSG